MYTFISRITTTSILTVALLMAGCAGVADPQLDEPENEQNITFENSYEGETNSNGGEIGTQDDSEPVPILPPVEEYD